MTSFVDRETELDTLQSRYTADEPSLITVWGRRRVGKTELVERSVRDREDAVHYQATQTTSQVQLDDFVDEAAATFPGVERIRREWEALLSYLLERDAVVVLDEFPFLIEADESLPSVVQRLWDHELDDTAGTLVLIGSSISMMKEKVMSGGSPLHGRFDTRLRLGELPFDAVSQLLPAYDPDQQVFAWAIFGGTPHYLQAVDDGRSLAANVREAVLSKRGFLHDEPEYVLRTELAEPNRYFAVLRAIAAGETTPNEIAQTAGIGGDQISNYLKTLQDLEIVRRRVPVTEDPVDSRRGRYELQDALFRFWFRFVYGHGDRYDRVGADAYEQLVEPHLPDFASPTFEELCRRATRELYDDYTFDRVGSWWYQEREVDVVGLTTQSTLVVGECKFTNSPVGYDVLQRLEDDAAEIRWPPRDETEYCLFARSGFRQSLREAAAGRDDLRLVSTPEALATLR